MTSHEGATRRGPGLRSAWLRWTAVAAVGLVGLVVPLVVHNSYYLGNLILFFVLVVLGSGWNIMGGYAGYISLGHSVFIGVGAYTAGILAARWDVSPFLVAPLGGVTAALLAATLAVVTRRTRGASFVIVSFALLELAGILVRNWSSVTGGSQGFAMPLPGWRVDRYEWPFYYYLFGLAGLSVLLSWWVRRTKFGLGLFAIRDDEDKAAALGVLTPVYKGLAFVAASVLVGVAGAIYGYYLSYLTVPALFDVVLSVQVVLAVLMGGRGTVWGPVLGAAIVVPLIEVTNTTIGGADAGAIRQLMFGGALLAVVMVMPRGIIPQVADLAARWQGVGTVSPTGARLPDRSDAAQPASPGRFAGAGHAVEVVDLRKRFGGVAALDGATARFPDGAISGLIGPNGSGKTTLFNVIDGTYRPDTGDVLVDGRSVLALDRTRRAFRGIARTYQLPRLFDQLTVLENVAIVNPSFQVRRLAHSAVSGDEVARATEFLVFVGMDDYVQVPASELSYGQRKLVELAQVLMLDPHVILLDEPAAGINPTLLSRLAGMIRTLNEMGRTIIIVEHDMHFVMSLADHVVVLAHGDVIATGTAAEVISNPDVVEAYLGDDFVLADDIEVPT